MRLRDQFGQHRKSGASPSLEPVAGAEFDRVVSGEREMQRVAGAQTDEAAVGESRCLTKMLAKDRKALELAVQEVREPLNCAFPVFRSEPARAQLD